jgi:hypothetical protein
MHRGVLMSYLASCNEQLEQTDRNIIAQRKRVDAAAGTGADASLSSDLLRVFQEIRRALLKRQDWLIVHIGTA